MGRLGHIWIWFFFIVLVIVIGLVVETEMKKWLEKPQATSTFVTFLSNPEDSSRTSVYWDTAQGFPQAVSGQAVQGVGRVSTEAEVKAAHPAIENCLYGWLSDKSIAKSCQSGVTQDDATGEQYGLWGTIEAPTLAAAKNIIYNIDMVPDGLTQIS